MTVGEALALYARERLATQARGNSTGRSLEAALAPFLTRPIFDLATNEIASRVEQLGVETPVHANRMLAYIKAFYEWARAGQPRVRNPARPIALPTAEAPRSRGLTLQEVGRIWRFASTLGYPFGPAVRMLIATAGQREQIGAMRVADFRLIEGGGLDWIVPGELQLDDSPVEIRLPEPAAAALRAALVARPPGSPFVFSGTGATPISGWSRAKARLDALLAAEGGAIADWRLNDLRAAFAAVAAERLDQPEVVIDACLGRLSQYARKPLSLAWATSEDMTNRRGEVLADWMALVEVAAAALPG